MSPNSALLPYATAQSQTQSGQIDVSVVIICFNDAKHLPAAVRSVLTQTLHNLEVLICDDFSTDNTPEVAKRLCAADSRVSYHRLPQNSGGCGGPRNLGIAKARGRYIMFLDSDDVLERHATKNMLLTAEADGSEIVAGLTVREAMYGKRKSHRWYSSLYAERRRLESVAEFPEFIHDTTATNKLYAKSFFDRTGLRFPEDMHYEDIAFSAAALTQAAGISIIPEAVYYWRVYAKTVRHSITNQRHDAKNLRDRMRAVSAAGEVYAAVSAALALENDVKTLKHHLRLYLYDSVAHSETRFRQLVAAVRDYLDVINPAAAARLTPAERSVYAAVCGDDLRAARQCVAAAKFGGLAGVVTASAGGDTVWRVDRDVPLSQHPLAVACSDFRDTGLLSRTPQQVPFAVVAETVSVRNGVYQMSGFVTDPTGVLRREGAKLRILSVRAGSKTLRSKPCQPVPDGAALRWEAELPVRLHRSLRGRAPYLFEAEIKLQGGAVLKSGVRYADRDGAPAAVLPDNSVGGVLFGENWRLGGFENDRLRLRLEAKNLWGRQVRTQGRLLLRQRAAQHLLKRVRQLRSPHSPVNAKYVAPLYSKLPLVENLAVFESHMGGSAYDNPRAVFTELQRRCPQMRFVWVHNGDSRVKAELPRGVTVVKRHSVAYQVALSRAKFLVDNQSFPTYFKRRRGQVYLQTWHGIPYKKIGLALQNSPAERDRVRASVAQWSALISPSDYFAEVFLPSFEYAGRVISGGYPRNDELLYPTVPADRVRQSLGLQEGHRVVLYCPTFRDGTRGSRNAPVHLDLEAWAAQFPDNVVLLVRSHYLNRFQIPQHLLGKIIDVSEYGNIADLYRIADTLITDYSSVMFDYAHLERPIIIFAPDYEQLTTTGRGAYFDLEKWAPGEFTRTPDELFAAVRAGLAAPAVVDPRLTVFRERFCGVNDGRAAARAVDYLLGEETV